MLLGAAFLIAASPLMAPQLLAFPYSYESEIGTIRSEQPLSPQLIADLVTQTRERLATSPIASKNERRPIFLTDGGWRWGWLANSSRGAFALTRPLTRAVVVNRVETRDATVRNGKGVGGKRRLAAVLAHEFTHGLIRRRYGLASVTFPQWKVEGYCDHVAGESSLTAEDAARLEAAGTAHPALPYYHGRQRVAAILAANGGSVDRLFTQDD